jgi:ureidoacrylate peracid hydrolase
MTVDDAAASTRHDWVRQRLAPDAASLVVIDAQNDFCHMEGRQALQGQDVGRVAVPLRRLAGSIEDARACSVPVIFVRTHHGASTDTEAWLARHPDPAREQSCQVGTWGAEFHGVAPLPGEIVITKHRYSAFVGTRLREVLAELGRPSVIFAGFTTATCVESSLRDAVNGDLLATLLEDCSAAYSEAAHQRAIDAVSSGFGLVTTSDELRRRWRPPSTVPPFPALEEDPT